MNKFLLMLLLFFSCHLEAQDSLVPIRNEKLFTEITPKNESVFTPRTFGKNFKKKYTDAAFIYEFKAPEKNAWDRFKEWLADKLRNLFRFTSNESALGFVNILLRVVAVLIVIFVIYMIVKALLNKEGRWIFGRNTTKKIIHYGDIEKNLHHIDFEKLIRNSLASGDTRISIRYYYLWLLKIMSEKGLITWDIEKTNSDYLYEIKNEVKKAEFAYASYLYNYIWYGEFEMDSHTFEKAKAAIEKMIKSISNG